MFDDKTIARESMLFDDRTQEMYSVNKRKIVLNREDHKGRARADGITTLARGYSA